MNEQRILSDTDDPNAPTRAPTITTVIAPADQGLAPASCGNPIEPWGPAGGNTEIIVSGDNFLSGASFFVGGQPAQVSGTVQTGQARIITPPGRPGAVDVIVVNPNGTLGRKPGAFVYCAEPARVCLNFLTGSGCPIPVDDDEDGVFCPVDSVTALSCPVGPDDLNPKVEVGGIFPVRVRVRNLPGGDDLRGVEFCAAPPCDLDNSDDIDVAVTASDGASIALFAGPTPTSRDLMVGETGVFRYDFAALTPGSIGLGVRISGYNDRLNSILLFPAGGPVQHPATFRLTPLQAIVSVNSERVSAGDQIRVTVNIGNAGPRALAQVAPSTPTCNGDGDATLRFSSVPTEAEALPVLPPFGVTEFILIYEARCEGSLLFSSIASALDIELADPVVEGVERTSPLITIEGSLESCDLEPERIDCPR